MGGRTPGRGDRWNTGRSGVWKTKLKGLLRPRHALAAADDAWRAFRCRRSRQIDWATRTSATSTRPLRRSGNKSARRREPSVVRASARSSRARTRPTSAAPVIPPKDTPHPQSAAARPVVEHDARTVALRDPLDDREAEAAAARVAGGASRVAAMEAVEDALAFVRCDAGPSSAPSAGRRRRAVDRDVDASARAACSATRCRSGCRAA